MDWRVPRRPTLHIEPGAEPDGIGGAYTWVRPPLGPNLPKVPKWLWRVFEGEPQPRFTGPKLVGNGGRPDAQKLAALVSEVEANGPGSANRDSILYWASKRAIEEVAQGRYGPRAAYDALYAAGLSIGQPHYEIRRALRDLGKLVGGQ